MWRILEKTKSGSDVFATVVELILDLALISALWVQASRVPSR